MKTRRRGPLHRALVKVLPVTFRITPHRITFRGTNLAGEFTETGFRDLGPGNTVWTKNDVLARLFDVLRHYGWYK